MVSVKEKYVTRHGLCTSFEESPLLRALPLLLQKQEKSFMKKTKLLVNHRDIACELHGPVAKTIIYSTPCITQCVITCTVTRMDSGFSELLQCYRFKACHLQIVPMIVQERHINDDRVVKNRGEAEDSL